MSCCSEWQDCVITHMRFELATCLWCTKVSPTLGRAVGNSAFGFFSTACTVPQLEGDALKVPLKSVQVLLVILKQKLKSTAALHIWSSHWLPFYKGEKGHPGSDITFSANSRIDQNLLLLLDHLRWSIYCPLKLHLSPLPRETYLMKMEETNKHSSVVWLNKVRMLLIPDKI